MSDYFSPSASNRCRFPFPESASVKHSEANKMECKPDPSIKLRILCNAQCGAKVTSSVAFSAHFDVNPDAASGVAFDATHDAQICCARCCELSCQVCATSFAHMLPTNFPRSTARLSAVACGRARESEGSLYVAGQPGSGTSAALASLFGSQFCRNDPT